MRKITFAPAALAALLVSGSVVVPGHRREPDCWENRTGRWQRRLGGWIRL